MGCAAVRCLPKRGLDNDRVNRMAGVPARHGARRWQGQTSADPPMNPAFGEALGSGGIASDPNAGAGQRRETSLSCNSRSRCRATIALQRHDSPDLGPLQRACRGSIACGDHGS